MNRLYFGLAFVLAFTLQLPVRAQRIAFESGVWKEVLARAKSEKKLIFVDVYATWCGPCKMLDQQVFTDKKVATTYNTLFLNYKVDAERGEGVNLARQYGVRAYPTALFIDGDGQLVDTWVGFLPATEFKKEGERVFRKTPVGLTLYLYETAYNNGNRTPGLIKPYLGLRRQAGLSTADILNEYVGHLPADSLQTPAVVSLVLAHISTCNGPAFNMLMRRKNEPRFRSTIDVVIQNDINQAGIERNRTKFNEICRLVEQLESAERASERIAYYQLVYHANAEDWRAYAEQADAYTIRYLLPKLTAEVKQQQPTRFQEGNDQLCNLSYFVSQHSKEDTRLKAFLAHLVAVETLNPTPLNTSLQACLRYRLGERDEAVALQTRALDLARMNGDDISSYEETLRRMQKKKAL